MHAFSHMHMMRHVYTREEDFVHCRGRETVVENPQVVSFNIECVEDGREHVDLVTRQDVGQLGAYGAREAHLRNILGQLLTDHILVTSGQLRNDQMVAGA